VEAYEFIVSREACRRVPKYSPLVDAPFDADIHSAFRHSSIFKYAREAQSEIIAQRAPEV